MLGCGTAVAAAGRCVNHGFLRFERIVSRRLDRATKALGPVFVAIALVLIGTCAFVFFEAVFPERFLQPTTPRWRTAVGGLWSIYLSLMFSFHYYIAIATPPGAPTDPLPARRPRQLPLVGRLFLRIVSPSNTASASRPDHRPEQPPRRERQVKSDEKLVSGGSHLSRRSPSHSPTNSQIDYDRREGRYARTCKKCPPLPSGQRSPKPERTHHCSVCSQCVLKFDHHCPWIKGCVGLHNERSFMLFLVYFSIACLFAAWWGFAPAKKALYLTTSGERWLYRTPRLFMLLSEVLSSVMGIAVLIMSLSQLLLVIRAQTNVESNDNSWYRKVAEARGRKYLNPYDLGWRANLSEFFNVGTEAEARHHWTALLLPVALPPASDGWSWRKRQNWQRYAMAAEDELTDEEQASEGEEFD